MQNEISAGSLANYLNGRQYLEEITEQEEKLAQENNLVIVFGASDDLIEFRGVFNEEFGATEEFYFNKEFKIIADHEEIEVNQNDIDLGFNILFKFNFHQKLENKITQEWCPEDVKSSWRISANFKHYPFNIYEGEDLYCIGIVFSIDDLK